MRHTALGPTEAPLATGNSEAAVRKHLEARDYIRALELPADATGRQIIQRVSELRARYPALTNLLADAQRALTADRAQYDRARARVAEVHRRLRRQHGEYVEEVIRILDLDLYEAVESVGSSGPSPVAGLLEELVRGLPPERRQELQRLLPVGQGAGDPVEIVCRYVERLVGQLPEVDIDEAELRAGSASRTSHPAQPPCACGGTGVLGPCGNCGGSGAISREVSLEEMEGLIQTSAEAKQAWEDALRRANLPTVMTPRMLIPVAPDVTFTQRTRCPECEGAGQRRCPRGRQVTLKIPRNACTGFVLRGAVRRDDGYPLARLGKIAGRLRPVAGPAARGEAARAAPRRAPQPAAVPRRADRPTMAARTEARGWGIGLAFWLAGLGAVVWLAWIYVFSTLGARVLPATAHPLVPVALYFAPALVALVALAALAREAIWRVPLLGFAMGSGIWLGVGAANTRFGAIVGGVVLGLGVVVTALIAHAAARSGRRQAQSPRAVRPRRRW